MYPRYDYKYLRSVSSTLKLNEHFKVISKCGMYHLPCVISCYPIFMLIIFMMMLIMVVMMMKTGASINFSDGGGGGAKVRQMSKFSARFERKFAILNFARGVRRKIKILYVY